MTTPDRPASARRPWRLRLSVAGGMVLVAAVAVGLASWDHNRRVRVRFRNQSSLTVTTATLEYEGQTIELGPIEPGGTGWARIQPSRTGQLTFACRLADRPRPVMNLQVPMAALGPGGLVEVEILNRISGSLRIEGQRKYQIGVGLFEVNQPDPSETRP